MTLTKGIFNKHKSALVTFDTKPGANDMVWIDQSNGVIYNYDNFRGEWLSTSKDKLEFARKGSANGMALPLLGDLGDLDDVYALAESSIITGIFCKSKSGSTPKYFQIIRNDTVLFTFEYTDNKLMYSNNSLNIPVNYLDELSVYVTKSNSSISNTICRLELARRLII